MGNDMFALFLDKSMMYSCALFERPDMSLATAQAARLERVCSELELAPDDHLLEIGTGWGGLATYAAGRYGCRVTTTTISEEQPPGRAADRRRRGRGQGRGPARGLPRPQRPLRQARLAGDDRGGRLAVLRRLTSAVARELLTDDGLPLRQAIVCDDRVYELEKASKSFASALIFPGGCLPSVEVIQRCTAKVTDMATVWMDDISEHYSETRATGASASSPTRASPRSWATTSPSAASGPCGWR